MLFYNLSKPEIFEKKNKRGNINESNYCFQNTGNKAPTSG